MFKLAFIITSLIATYSFAQITPSRMREIHAQVEKVALFNFDDFFSYENDESFPGPAASMKIFTGYYVMKINPKIMNTLSPAAQKIIYYHEVGHYFLGHLDQPYLSNKDYQRTIELEADAFSALIFKKREVVNADVYKFMDFLRKSQGMWPVGHERASLFEFLLAQP